MKKPTISEITAYCSSRNNNIDAETFWHHYESNGWKVGKNAIPMSNWKSAIITWEKRDPKPKEINRPPKPETPPMPVKRMFNKDGSLMNMRQIIEAGGNEKALKIYDDMQAKKKRKDEARLKLGKKK